MARSVWPLAGGIVSVLAIGTLGAQAPSSEAAPVVAAVQRLFDAMARRDTLAARELLLPGSRVVALPSDTLPARPRVQSDSAFLRGLAARPDRLLERMWAPVVQVQGPIATVWAPYDFHRNGQWSHCGIDTVTLVRTAVGWQIAGLAYTVRRQGCVPSPLGVPKQAPAP
jgi:hypothetical protein